MTRWHLFPDYIHLVMLKFYSNWVHAIHPSCANTTVVHRKHGEAFLLVLLFLQLILEHLEAVSMLACSFCVDKAKPLKTNGG